MDVREYIEANASGFFTTLKEWLAIPSISGDPARRGDVRRSAEWLEAHPDVASVNYAGLPSSPWHAAAAKYAPLGVGAVLSFELKGGVDAGRALVEASGGITLSRIQEIAATGVDIISVGALTHSAPALDLGLDMR